MNDADVSKQIQQMVRFIRQEAEEKANEISVSAEEEFNIEKVQLVETEKKKVRQEYERKNKQVEVRKKIEYSVQLNASRIKVLQAQDDMVHAMRDAASKELLRVSEDKNANKSLLKGLIVQVVIADESHFQKNAQAKRTNASLPILQLEALYPDVYKNVHEYGNRYCKGGIFGVYQGASNHEELHNLMKATVMIRRLKKYVLFELPVKRRQQSLLRLKEPAVLLRCREMDTALVKSVLEEAKKEYAEKAEVKAPSITIDNHVYLPPPPSGADTHAPSCSGGVVLASRDGKIVCENTLNARLDVVFRQKLPEIRKKLVK